MDEFNQGMPQQPQFDPATGQPVQPQFDPQQYAQPQPQYQPGPGPDMYGQEPYPYPQQPADPMAFLNDNDPENGGV